MANEIGMTVRQVEDARRTNPRPDDCEQCQGGTPVDHWPSPLCRSSYRDGRLTRTHCTCDLCW